MVKAQLPMQCGVVLGPGSNQANPSVAPPQNPGPSTTCFEVQNIRVNVHFLQHDDGTGNFTATDDGRPVNPSTTTRKA